jgi:SagB-type dehydrogenase family enzyme
VGGFYFSAAAVDADTRLRLSRFAYCRRLDDTLILESPLSTAKAILPDVLGGALVGSLAQPRTCREVRERLNASGAPDALDRGAVQSCLTLLAAAGLVGTADGDGRLAEDDDPALVQWEFHDLAFHARSRLGRHDYPFGGTFPFIGQIAPLPAVAPARSTAVVELFAPDVGRLGTQDPAFSEVLERRTSVREHGAAPITAQQLGAFLFRTARVRGIRPADSSRPYEATSRPYPSGGAAYDLEIYVTVHRCDGIAPGLYRYLPVEHQLEPRAASAGALAQLLRDAQSAAAASGPPQLLITLTSRFARLSWKYRSMAYATTLKNVGVLLQTMYLVATAMDLAPCALGGGNSSAFAAAAGTSEFEESSVGEFILGSRDRS